MSKAFTKEDSVDQISLKPEGPALPPGAKNYMTPRGAKRLADELEQLLGATLEMQRESELRIFYLQQRVNSLEVIDPIKQAVGQTLGKVRFGASVQVADEEGSESVYRIVGVDEADAKLGKLSWISPLAGALLGHEEGDSVRVKTPKGEKELEILKITYEEIL